MKKLFLLAMLVIAMNPVTRTAQATELVNFFFEEVFQISVSYDTVGTGNQVLTIFGRDQVSKELVDVSIQGIDRNSDANQDSSLNYCHDYALRVQAHTTVKKPESKMGLSISGQGESDDDIDLSKAGNFVECSILVGFP